MQFIRTSDWQPGIEDLTKRIQSALSGNDQVLWLLPGGSNISASVSVMEHLDSEHTKNLTLLLTDERYGPVGHQNSNAAQLNAAGFAPKQATMLPVLVAGLDLEATRAHYEQIALEAFQKATIIIGQFGMGADGHIAGILPHSEAVDATEFVAAYEANEFTRLTLTAHALKRLSAAYVFVFGDSKADALERLHDQTLPYADEPSQIVKELPEAYIYNDQIGDSI
jgi:6-phosphogluconolactonase/glucosamine-6-phosphate isomerase/deaminase